MVTMLDYISEIIEHQVQTGAIPYGDDKTNIVRRIRLQSALNEARSAARKKTGSEWAKKGDLQNIDAGGFRFDRILEETVNILNGQPRQAQRFLTELCITADSLTTVIQRCRDQEAQPKGRRL